MRVEFKELREQVKIVEVLARYKISLRYRPGSDYAGGACPLKCHPADDRNNAFCVHLPSNRFQCKNAHCQKSNGVGDLWGDCINLVAAIEGTGFKEAAAKLVQMFEIKAAIPKNSGPAGSRATSGAPPLADISEHSAASGNGKGYIHEAGLWLDVVLKVVPELDRQTTKKLIMNKLLESYKNGKAAR